jgi:hypothetical protein
MNKEYIKSYLNKLNINKYRLISKYLLDIVNRDISILDILTNKELKKIFVTKIYDIKDKLTDSMLDSVDNNNLFNSYKTLLQE